MEKREYWAWISTVENMYYNKISRLVESFGSIENVYMASATKLENKGKMKKEDVDRILKSKEKFNSDDFFRKLNSNDINFVCIEDLDYPKRLLPYEHKPFFLYYRGKIPDMDRPIVSIVGARACSGYGRNMAKMLGEKLSDYGVQIVSGMARGIDTFAQLGALNGESATFGVLGCGVDICYPTENIELYENILKKGGIISEYLPGTKPNSWHFPQRNRIISGISDIVVVVEAKEKSGSLITVEWALEQGKNIMAVPGRVGDKLSSGCNRLIKTGAGIVTSEKDILEELKYYVFKEERKINAEEKILEKEFLMLYSELGLQPKNIYELIESTGLSYEKLVDMLLQLQLKGLVTQPSYNYYSRLK